jgi:hypothetical protein
MAPEKLTGNARLRLMGLRSQQHLVDHVEVPGAVPEHDPSA